MAANSIMIEIRVPKAPNSAIPSRSGAPPASADALQTEPFSRSEL